MPETTATIDQAGAAKKSVPAMIDSDVHLLAPQGLVSIWDHFSRAWQEHFEAKGVGLKAAAIGVSAKTMRFTHPTGAGVRSDAITPAGKAPGSDRDFVTAQLLEEWDIDIAIVNAIDAAAYAAGLANPDESSVICEAYNRYFIEQWIEEDDRYRFLLTANPQDPVAAAAEIRRIGNHPGVVGIFIPPTNVLLGNRWFHPLYESACEFNLPIWTHVTGIEYVHQGAPVPAVGSPESYAERRSVTAHMAESNVASVAFSGVLQRFPELRFCFAEFGFSWALTLLWKMDDTWRACRRDTPWVVKAPSEYIHERVRFTTQPLDEPTDHQHLLNVIDMLGSDLLLFSSDYPHWDNDNPRKVMQSWPEQLRTEVCGTNPREFWSL